MAVFAPLTGRAAIITGGSRGIGRGIASVFVEAGMSVLLTARDEDGARQAVAELRSDGGEASYLVADVADPEAGEVLARTALDRYGRIDVLCCNAGVFPQASLREMTASDVDGIVAVNLRGTILSVRACLPAMEKARWGRIVLTSSITGPLTGHPGWSHYGATKAAQLGFMRTAAIELAPHGITINAVLPGNIATEGLGDVSDDYADQVLQTIPLGRLGTVREVAAAALFLATEEAGYITGQTLVVDGGQVLPEWPLAAP
jgi:3-oxoacyl-[acyl-carrier protein] reductase